MPRHGVSLLLAVSALPAMAAAQVTLYVSPDGKDAWTGRLDSPNAKNTDGPFSTLERARDAVRKLRALDKRERHPARRVTVLLRGGTYTLAKTLVFRPEDSGTEEAPTVYTAYPGETPVISGGRHVTGWRKSNGQLWVARAPKGWYFTRLFVNGKKKARAREPDTDNWNRWWQVVDGGPPEPDAPEGMGSREFKFPPNTLRNWENLADIEVNSLPSFRYANFISSLAKVDEPTSTATLRSMAYYNFKPGDPFRVENAPEALDQPGEWCVNTVSGTVYYWPQEEERMEQAEAIAPALTELVRFQGNEQEENFVHDMVLRGFTFTHCDRRRWHEHPEEDEANLHGLDSAVYLEGTERCAIEDCRFVEVAGFGARFNLTARGNRFVGNEVVGAGCGAIQLGGYGPGTKDVNKGHTISHNHIHHSSTDFWHAGAIDIRQSGENQIAHNLIHHMPYTAIMISGAHTAYFKQYRGKGPGIGRAKYNFRWDEIPDDDPLTAESVKPFLHGRNNTVEHNVVYEVLGRLPADGGALYGFGQGLGNVFRSNLVYRAHCLAIYLDNEFDGVLVENNVVYDSASPFGGSGANPTLVGNALFEAGKAPPEVQLLGKQMMRIAEQATGPYWHRTVMPEEATRPRDSGAREFAATFGAMAADDLAGQGGWEPLGPGPSVAIGEGMKSEGCDPGTVAVAGGNDSWAAIWHGIHLDQTKGLLLQIDACLAAPLTENSFFELYLNQGQIHANAAFGVALVGGAENGCKDAVGVRQDAAGPRVLATERLRVGHWYRLRLLISANTQECLLFGKDLTAGEKEFRPLTFANGVREADLTQGDKWMPDLASLDALVLRLGGSAQAANIVLQNPPVPGSAD